MLHRGWWRMCRKFRIRGNNLLVYLFLEAGPGGAGQYTGLYTVSIGDISDYTGLSDKDVERSIAELQRTKHIVYDPRKQVVFVIGMLARQSPNYSSSENSIQGVVNHVMRMPEGSIAVESFIKSQINNPELYDLLEWYLEGDEEGDIEQTLDLRL